MLYTSYMATNYSVHSNYLYLYHYVKSNLCSKAILEEHDPPIIFVIVCVSNKRNDKNVFYVF